MFSRLIGFVDFCGDTIAYYLCVIDQYLNKPVKTDPSMDIFFADHQAYVEQATWKISHQENIYYAHAGIIFQYRGTPFWSESRARRMLGFLRRYKGRYIPSIEKLQQAEILTQEHGITIEAADTLVQLRDRGRSLVIRQELIADDKANKRADRDYYLGA